ncbi:MAG: helix-turn-helix domain-containing protein [Cellvibrionaceae bacterium]
MITSHQIRMARAALQWSMTDISKRTGIHRNTLASIEKNTESARESTLKHLQACFEESGVSFEGDCCVCMKKSAT